MQTDPVILQLKAEVADYQRDVSRAAALSEQKLSAIEAKGFAMGQSLKNSFSLAKTAAVAFAGSLVVTKVVDLARAGLEYASSLGETAQQLGVTTAALQEYRYAAQLSGISSEEMDQALSQLTRRIGEAANGTKAQREAFEKLGISVKNAKGEVINAGEALPMMAEGLTRIESPAERAAILMDLVGRSGQKLEPMLAGGSAAVNELREAAHKLGIVLSDHQIQSADETADKLGALHTVLSSRIAGVVADNAGSIMVLANALATLVDWAGKAANAYKRFKLSQGLNVAESKANGWFVSPAERAKATQEANSYRAAIAQMDGTQDKSGGFRDYRAAPIQFRPVAPGAGAPHVAAAGGGARVSTPHVASGGTGHASGPSAAEIALRHAQEIGRLAQDELRAQLELATDADERAAIQKDLLFNEQQQRVAAVENDEHFTRAQKDAQIAYINRLYGSGMKGDVITGGAKSLGAQIIDREHDQATARLAQALLEEQQRTLESQADIETNVAKRRDLEKRILEVQQQIERSRLEEAISTGQISAGARDELAAQQAIAREKQRRASLAPGAAFAEDLKASADNINEAVQSIEVEGLKSLNSELADAVMGTKSLGDAFKSVANQIIGDLLRIAIQRSIIGPLANLLFSGGSAIGGDTKNLESNFDHVFGRASGGPVSAGKLYRINESGREYFQPAMSGKVLPAGDVNARVAGGGGTVVQQHFHLDARGAVLTQDIVEQINAMGQEAAVAGAQGGHAASMREIAKMGRPRM